MFNEWDRRCAAVQPMLSTYKLWQQDHCQHPQNANLDGSTLEGTAQRIGQPFGGGGVEAQGWGHCQKTRTKEFIEKVQTIIDETPQRLIRQIARDLGISHTTVNACVKEDLKCRSYRCQTSHIMPPHIFEVGLKVNTKVYLDVLKSVVIPWCNQVAGGRPWVWQQDLAMAQKSKETQAWLQKECYEFVPFSHWAPSTPDLNPLDYFVWSYVENITNLTLMFPKSFVYTQLND